MTFFRVFFMQILQSTMEGKGSFCFCPKLRAAFFFSISGFNWGSGFLRFTQTRPGRALRRAPPRRRSPQSRLRFRSPHLLRSRRRRRSASSPSSPRASPRSSPGCPPSSSPRSRN